jgi:hypothetical protein
LTLGFRAAARAFVPDHLRPRAELDHVALAAGLLLHWDLATDANDSRWAEVCEVHGSVHDRNETARDVACSEGEHGQPSGARINRGSRLGRLTAGYCHRGVGGAALLKPAPNNYLQRWPVSKRVNSSKADADDATLIERLELA